MQFFAHVEKAPVDPILGLNQAFLKDSRKNKVNLGVGAYKTSDLKPYVLESIQKAEEKLHTLHLTKEYLPIDGDPYFLFALQALIFENSMNRPVYAMQSIGGTGALGVAARFLIREKISNEIYISNPTWDNHRRLFEMSGFQVKTYPYYNPQTKGIDFDKLCKSIIEMPKGAVILLQAACHNPTGCDLNNDQWDEVLHLIGNQKLLPFFDIAYQGFGTSLNEDVAMVRKFAKTSNEMIVAYSCSKNFGLYGERVGACFFICNSKQEVESVGSKVRQVIRGIYSSPPSHGSRLVTAILTDPNLCQLWFDELEMMRERISKMRKKFVKQLSDHLPEKSFQYLQTQKGMFSYTGLSENQTEELISEFGIYLTRDGRISIAGLPPSPEFEKVIDAFVREFSKDGAKRGV